MVLLIFVPNFFSVNKHEQNTSQYCSHLAFGIIQTNILKDCQCKNEVEIYVIKRSETRDE